MIVVIGKDKKLFRIISCKQCGSELQYLDHEIQIGYRRINDKEILPFNFIECPACWERVIINV